MKSLALCVVCAMAGIARAQPVPDADAYRAALAKAFDESWNPREALGDYHGPDLGPFRVQLHVVISADGHVTSVTVRQSSGYAFFDDAAVVAVTLARPPVPPAKFLDQPENTLSINWWMGAAGWEPPHYAGDAMAATPMSPRGEVGASFEVDSRTHALSGSSSVARNGASFSRTALTATALWTFPRIAILEIDVPYETVSYREPTSSTTADLSGLGDISLHAHSWHRWGNYRLDGFVGLVLPTGDSAKDPILGRQLPAIVELGSGRPRIDYGLCWSRTGVVGVGICESFSASFGSSDSFEEPVVSDTRLYAALPVLCRHVQLFAAALYEHRDGASFSVDTEAGTVTTTVGRVDELFGELGVWAVLWRGVTVRGTVELPVYENVGGAQLADTVRAMGSLSYDFDR